MTPRPGHISLFGSLVFTPPPPRVLCTAAVNTSEDRDEPALLKPQSELV